MKYLTTIVFLFFFNMIGYSQNDYQLIGIDEIEKAFLDRKTFNSIMQKHGLQRQEESLAVSDTYFISLKKDEKIRLGDQIGRLAKVHYSRLIDDGGDSPLLELTIFINKIALPRYSKAFIKALSKYYPKKLLRRSYFDDKKYVNLTRMGSKTFVVYNESELGFFITLKSY